jgi:hypothetical protein
MSDSGKMDDALRHLAAPTGELPPLPDELEKDLEDLPPVEPRSPLRQLAFYLLISLAVCALLVAALKVRRDLAQLPTTWLLLYVGAWLAAFCGLSYFALVPRGGAISPRARLVGVAAIVVSGLFVIGGLIFSRHVPGLSTMTPETPAAFVSYGHACLRWGLITAIAPIGIGAMFLRGAVPAGARWVAAGLGAAGGALGGMMLHLHCPISDKWHLGLVHGGVVVIAAALAALLLQRLLRP